MSRNFLVLLIVLLSVGVGVLGYWFYREQQRPNVEISVGPRGVSIQGR